MIHSLLPIDNSHATCEEEAAELSVDSTCFRELIRTTSVESMGQDCEEKDTSTSPSPPPPSPFALAQNSICAEEEKGTIKTQPHARMHRHQYIDETEESTQEPTKHQASLRSFAAPYLPASPVAATSALHAPPIATESLSAPAEAIRAILENASQGISHIYAKDIQETTLTLDGPRFTGTPLEGVKLIVREYSTAPRAYNICFVCVPAGLAYLQPHLMTMRTFFQNRKLPFSIHSIEADLGDGIPSPIDRASDSSDDQEHEESRG